MRRGHHGDGQQQRDAGLDLEKQQHLPGPVVAPAALQLGIARIVGALARASRDMYAEAQRPECHQRRDQPVPGRELAPERCKRRGNAGDADGEAPERIGPARVSRGQHHPPGHRHGGGGEQADDEDREPDAHSAGSVTGASARIGALWSMRRRAACQSRNRTPLSSSFSAS